MRCLAALTVTLGSWVWLAEGAMAADLPMMLELKGSTVDVHYTPGALDRASNLQDRMELFVSDLSSWTGQGLSMQVYVLSRDDWKVAEIDGVFGFPARIARQDLAMPSWGDKYTVGVWEALLGHDLPAVPGMPMRGSPDEAASLSLGDFLAGPEAARILLAKAGVSGDRDWVAGVLAHACALAAQMKHEPTRRSEGRLMWQGLAERRDRPGLNTQQGRLFVKQMQAEAAFHEAADLIQGESGKPQAKTILKRARKNGDLVTAAALLESYPQLGPWVGAWDGARREVQQ